MFVFHLILLYTACVSAQDNESASTDNDILDGTKSDPNVYHNNLDALLESKADRSNESDIATWFTHMEVLTKASNKALTNIRRNIKHNDYFNVNFKRLFEELFKNIEYENTLQSELKKMMEFQQFDASHDNMFRTMNMTVSLIETVLSRNMEQMEVVVPTKWYKHLKDKVIKQEVKAASGYVAKKMCDKGVCKDPINYSDYVKIWLRYLLNLKAESLHEFFAFIPDALEKHKHFIKSNIKFRKLIKHLIDSDVITQKDYLAVLDDVLDNPKLFTSLPSRAKTSSTLLWLFFEIIDENYNITDENKKELKRITKMFGNLMEGKAEFVPSIFDMIIENIQINNKIWPINEQYKLEKLWTEMIH